MTSPAAATEQPARLRRAAVATGAVFAANGVLFATWVTRLPALRDQVGASKAELGAALLCLGGGSVLSMSFAGPLCRRFGSRAVVRLVVAWACCALPPVAWTTSVATLAAELFVVGLGYGLWDVAMNVQGHQVEHAAGRVFMPRYHAAWSAGTLGGAAVGSLAAHWGVDPRWHFLTLSAVAVAAALAASTAMVGERPREVTGSPAGRAPGRVPGRALVAAGLVLLGLLTVCDTVAEGAAGDWLAILLVDHAGLSQGLAAAGFTTYSVAMLVGRAVGTDIVERVGRVPALRGAGLLTAAGVVLTVLDLAVALDLVGAALWGLGLALVFPVAMSAAGERGPRPESAIAVVSAIGYAGFLVGPPTIGWLADRVGLDRALLVVVVLGLGIAVLAPVARTGRTSATGRTGDPAVRG